MIETDVSNVKLFYSAEINKWMQRNLAEKQLSHVWCSWQDGIHSLSAWERGILGKPTNIVNCEER